MAKKCDLCGRGATRGASRSHSKIRTLRRQNINLQSLTIEGVKMKVCTSCLRTMNKPERIKTKRKPALAKGTKLVKAPKKAKAKKAKK
jgi:ribosomal protein L28